MSARRQSNKSMASALYLQQMKPGPIVMVRGANSTIADRALAYLRASAMKAEPDLEVTEIWAGSYQAGRLAALVSPSLFGDSRLIQVNDVDAAGDDLLADLLDYFADPEPGVVVLLHHRGGNRLKKLVDAVNQAGVVYAADAVRRRGDRVSLLQDEVAYRRGTIEPAAAQRLADAVGDDLDELLGTVRQLMDDNNGAVTLAAVDAYFAGRLDTTGFDVADAVAAGEGPRAVLLARRAASSGIVPVLLVAAIAQKLRDIAKVTVRGISQAELGMAPWQVDQARRNARGWSPEALGAAICLVARADQDVKGASRDPAGAVERCIIEISRVRASHR